jgi:putative endonuclease
MQNRSPVYYESFGDIRNAINREKQINGLLRTKKIALIVSRNPAWRHLSEEWYRALVSQRGEKSA